MFLKIKQFSFIWEGSGFSVIPPVSGICSSKIIIVAMKNTYYENERNL